MSNDMYFFLYLASYAAIMFWQVVSHYRMRLQWANETIARNNGEITRLQNEVSAEREKRWEAERERWSNLRRVA